MKTIWKAEFRILTMRELRTKMIITTGLFLLVGWAIYYIPALDKRIDQLWSSWAATTSMLAGMIFFYSAPHMAPKLDDHGKISIRFIVSNLFNVSLIFLVWTLIELFLTT